MPHFGLMDETALGPVRGPRERARLHLRCGRRRLREGKISAGIVTLYDAVQAAMESYAAAAPELPVDRRDLNDEKKLYTLLVDARALDGTFDFEGFARIADSALDQELPGFDYGPLLCGIETLMVQLGVSPFDEAALPPEDPATF